jgi:hypothetical protein
MADEERKGEHYVGANGRTESRGCKKDTSACERVCVFL